MTPATTPQLAMAMAVTTLARPATEPTLRSISAAGDHVGHADRDHGDGRGLPEDVQQVVGGQEALVAEQYREEDEDDDEADVDDVAAPVECGEPASPLTARRRRLRLRAWWSGSWLDSLDGVLEGLFVGDVLAGRAPCRTVPSRKIKTRSLTARSSAYSDEMTMTPLPSSARLRIMVEDLGFGADVDPGGRLVHDQARRARYRAIWQ